MAACNAEHYRRPVAFKGAMFLLSDRALDALGERRVL
jgi:hypothetical protein